MGTRCKTPGIKKELSGRALSLILRKKLSGFAFCFAPFFELCSQSTFTYGSYGGNAILKVPCLFAGPSFHCVLGSLLVRVYLCIALVDLLF